MLYFFFFFQAEDGIRDRTVTGVQTCALPISHERHAVTSSQATQGFLGEPLLLFVERKRLEGGDQLVRGRERSEERRVGKECRSRWSRYHEKKKSKEHWRGGRDESTR